MKTKILLLFAVYAFSSLSAWQPSNWVYRTGNYTYSIEDTSWYYKQPAWNHWSVNLDTGEWQRTMVEGWNYYLWPYFYSYDEQQWFFTADPGDQAWTLNLMTELWSIFGDATLTGQVLDYETGDPLAGALVNVQGRSATSQSEGYYSISGISESDRAVAAASLEGFAPQSRILSFGEGNATETFLLLAASAVEEFDPAQEQTLAVEDEPAQVVLAANSLTREDGGAPVGNVRSTITVIDAGEDPDLMPGDYSVAGTDDLIESFGALSVEFTDTEGAELDLNGESGATIRIPVAQGSTEPPATIPLFYYDEESGLWVEEGSATLSEDGTYYEGTVNHFSTWNADRLYSRAYVSGCVSDSDGNPVSGARVKSEGITYNGSATTYTDSDGQFTVAVKNNATALISATRNGIATNSTTAISGDAGTTEQLLDCLSLGSIDSTATIKLTWGENPRDLDSHLEGPTADQQGFHVYYANKGFLQSSPFVQLDVDDVTSFGPEVITINSFLNGTYSYYVRHYSGSSNISDSGARVELNLDGNIRVFTPPAGATGNSGEDWNVFDLVVEDQNISIVPVQNFE